MAFVESDGFGVVAVGQQSNAGQAAGFGELDGVLEQCGAKPLAAMVRMNNQVFQENDGAAFGGADGKEEIDHSPNLRASTNYQDAANFGVFDDMAQRAQLSRAVGTEIRFHGEEIGEEAGQLRKIVERGRFDAVHKDVRDWSVRLSATLTEKNKLAMQRSKRNCSSVV